MSYTNFVDIDNSGLEIGTHSGSGGSLQIAPDGKIYHSNGNSNQQYLSTIAYPDSIGLLCNFNANSFSLASGTSSIYGLPTFSSSILQIPPSGCDSVSTAIITINQSTYDTTQILATDNYFWSLSGINYSTSGLYSFVDTNISGCSQINILDLTIIYSGCTDPLALNYDPLASVDDSSCIYPCSISIIDTSNISCYGLNDGYIEVFANGTNTNNFNYRIEIYDSLFNVWIPVGQSPVNGSYTQLPVLFSNLYSGCYRLIVTDSSICNDTTTICLSEPEEINLVGNVTNVTLNNNGSIMLDSISGGTGPYNFSWTGPNGFVSSNQNIQNLESGFYYLTVVDDSLCQRDYVFFVDILILGCTDSTANNFNPLATINDSTCCYLNFYYDNVTICIEIQLNFYTLDLQ